MKRLNADKPHLWKADIAASVDCFNQWFMRYAPDTFRATRVETTRRVEAALRATNNLRHLDPATLKQHPDALPTLRMCAAPPLAVDRLIGLSGANKNVVKRLEEGKLPVKFRGEELDHELTKLCVVIEKLLDRDIFPWLQAGKAPVENESERAATIVADRLCSAVANPIVRNAQEQRQLAVIGNWLEQRGYAMLAHPSSVPLKKMKSGTFTFRHNVPVANANIPVDIVVQPRKPRRGGLPVLIEAKSAGDFTNTNKRRKEEATKIHQLQAAFGTRVCYVLFLCGYFGCDYLGYEAAEGLDWVWEHRIDDLKGLGL